MAFLCQKCASPPWEETASLSRQLVTLLSADEDKPLRATALYVLAVCLDSQPQPDWGAACAVSKQGLQFCIESGQKSGAVEALAQLAFLCAKCASPPWDETTALSRQVIGLLTEDDDKPLRVTALETLASLLGGRESPDFSAAAEAWEEAAEQLPRANNILGLVISLDCVGKFSDADAWIARLDRAKLGDEETLGSPLSRRREAYLALRRNDLEAVITIASGLRETSESARAMLLLSVACFVRGDHAKAHEAIHSAHSNKDDRAWFAHVAAAYFARHGGDIGQYRSLLLEMP